MHQLAHPALAVGHAKAPQHDLAEVDQPPSRYAVHLGIRPLQHDRLQGRLPTFRGPAGTTIAPIIRQPGWPAPVVADNPVSQRLPVHPGYACRRLAAQALKSRRDRQQAPRYPQVPLRLCQPP